MSQGTEHITASQSETNGLPVAGELDIDVVESALSLPDDLAQIDINNMSSTETLQFNRLALREYLKILKAQGIAQKVVAEAADYSEGYLTQVISPKYGMRIGNNATANVFHAALKLEVERGSERPISEAKLQRKQNLVDFLEQSFGIWRSESEEDTGEVTSHEDNQDKAEYMAYAVDAPMTVLAQARLLGVPPVMLNTMEREASLVMEQASHKYESSLARAGIIVMRAMADLELGDAKEFQYQQDVLGSAERYAAITVFNHCAKILGAETITDESVALHEAVLREALGRGEKFTGLSEVKYPIPGTPLDLQLWYNLDEDRYEPDAACSYSVIIFNSNYPEDDMKASL